MIDILYLHENEKILQQYKRGKNILLQIIFDPIRPIVGALLLQPFSFVDLSLENVPIPRTLSLSLTHTPLLFISLEKLITMTMALAGTRDNGNQQAERRAATETSGELISEMAALRTRPPGSIWHCVPTGL